MYVKLNVKCDMYRDSNSRSKLLELDDSDRTATLSNMTNEVSDEFTIAAGSTLTIDFGSVTDPRGLYIVAHGSYVLTLNGTFSLDIDKSAPSASENVPLFIPASNLTSVVIDNTGGAATLTGTYAVYGLRP